MQLFNIPHENSVFHIVFPQFVIAVAAVDWFSFYMGNATVAEKFA